MLAQLQFHASHLLPIAVALAAAATAWTLWLYGAQFRLVGRAWRWTLPALRTAAVVALGLALLKPVVVRPQRIEERGPVVMLMDRSLSMGVIDQRSPPQLVELAEAMGRLEASRASLRELGSRTSALHAQVDALRRIRSELEYARLAGRATDDVELRMDQTYLDLRREVAQLASIARREERVVGLAPEFARLAEALDLASAAEVALPPLDERIDRLASSLAQLRQTAAQELHDSDPGVRAVTDELARHDRLALAYRALFDEGASGPPLIDRIATGAPVILASFALGPPKPMPHASGEVPSPRADGVATDITGALRHTARQLAGRSAEAIVLISDGRQTTGQSDASAALVSPPIFAIDPTSPVRVDRALAGLSMPQEAYVDETITIRADVVARNTRQGKVRVALDFAGKQQTVEADIRDDRGRAEFRVKLEAPGTHIARVSVEEQPGEITLLNNTMTRSVRVLAEKVKVTAIGGSGTWEYQYLRSVMDRAPWVQSQDFFARASQPAAIAPEALMRQDVLFLSDVDPAALSAQQWDAVFQLVSERGGSVIVAFGDPELPARYSAHPLLAGLVPWPVDVVPQWRLWPGEEAFLRAVPAAGDEALDALRLADDPERNRLRWAELPAMYRVLPMAQLRPGARPLLVERESQLPVMAEMRLGAGRIITVGVPETWRWRHRVGERDHDRFWLQVVRHASEPPYASGDGGLSLDVDVVDPRPHQPLGLRARILDEQGQPRTDARPRVHIMRESRLVRVEPLSPIEATPGRFAAVAPGLEQGTYRLQLALSDDPPAEPVEPSIELIVQDDPHAELVDLSSDPAFLRKLADGSGGEVLRLDQIDLLPGKIAEIRRRRPALVEYALWSSPWVYLFVVGCLGAEWGLRKRLGLA